MAGRLSGKAVSWKTSYGFIQSDADKQQYFVHFSALNVGEGGYKSLTPGQDVEFDAILEADGRSKAVNVTSPGGAPLPSGPRGDGGFGGRGRGGRGGFGGGYGNEPQYGAEGGGAYNPGYGGRGRGRGRGNYNDNGNFRGGY